MLKDNDGQMDDDQQTTEDGHQAAPGQHKYLPLHPVNSNATWIIGCNSKVFRDTLSILNFWNR